MSKLNLPTKRIITQTNVVVMPSIDAVLSEALQTVSREITRLNIKSTQGRALDSNENRILQGYVKSLVEVSKEIREQERKQDFSDMSTEEIIDTLLNLLPKQELIDKLTSKEEPKKDSIPKEDKRENNR